MSIALPERLAEVFVELSDTLVTDFDTVDLLHRLTERCVELLDIDAAGLLLAESAEHGSVLSLAASSTERAQVLELFQLQDEEGPCLESYRTGRSVTVTDVGEAEQRWPRFAAATAELGFTGVLAVPMRLRAETIGSLNLFHSSPMALDATTERVARSLADVATIGLLQERTVRRQETLTEQLQTALNSRVSIEQAKGILAERLDTSMDQAFRSLRSYAREHGQKLNAVAHAVIDGSLDHTRLGGEASDRRTVS